VFSSQRGRYGRSTDYLGSIPKIALTKQYDYYETSNHFSNFLRPYGTFMFVGNLQFGYADSHSFNIWTIEFIITRTISTIN
jgi:hypothetical protein